MEEVRSKLEEAHNKIIQLTNINDSFTSEIKIQKRINSKLKKEIEFINTKSNDLESALEAERNTVSLVRSFLKRSNTPKKTSKRI